MSGRAGGRWLAVCMCAASIAAGGAVARGVSCDEGCGDPHENACQDDVPARAGALFQGPRPFRDTQPTCYGWGPKFAPDHWRWPGRRLPSWAWLPSTDTFPARQFALVSDLLFVGHFADHASPHRDRGCPLVGTSWLNRPLHVDSFLGVLLTESLRDELGLENSAFGGYRFGVDTDDYWGWEARFAFTYPEMENPGGPAHALNADLFWLDAKLMYYPWGNARWRPYTTIGCGVFNPRFTDENGADYAEMLFSMPVGVGMKCQLTPWAAARVDLVDNFIPGGAGVSTMHNLSITCGFEFRFGGAPTLYYPYDAGWRRW